MFWDILEMFFRLQELLFYKMKLEAMKRQAGRPRKNSVPVAQEFRGKTSREILGVKLEKAKTKSAVISALQNLSQKS